VEGGWKGRGGGKISPFLVDFTVHLTNIVHSVINMCVSMARIQTCTHAQTRARVPPRYSRHVIPPYFSAPFTDRHVHSAHPQRRQSVSLKYAISGWTIFTRGDAGIQKAGRGESHSHRTDAQMCPGYARHSRISSCSFAQVYLAYGCGPLSYI